MGVFLARRKETISINIYRAKERHGIKKSNSADLMGYSSASSVEAPGQLPHTGAGRRFQHGPRPREFAASFLLVGRGRRSCVPKSKACRSASRVADANQGWSGPSKGGSTGCDTAVLLQCIERRRLILIVRSTSQGEIPWGYITITRITGGSMSKNGPPRLRTVSP